MATLKTGAWKGRLRRGWGEVVEGFGEGLERLGLVCFKGPVMRKTSMCHRLSGPSTG